MVVPCRELCHDALQGTRVGEASHPGPHGSRKTARKRRERESELNPLLSMLRPLLQKMLKELLSDLLGKGSLSSLLGNLAKQSGGSFRDGEKLQKQNSKARVGVPTSKPQGDKGSGKTSGGLKSPKDVVMSAPSLSQKGKGHGGIQPKVSQPAASKPAAVHLSAGEWSVVSHKANKPFQLRDRDWSASVLEFNTLVSALEKCDSQETFSGIVLAPNGEQKVVIENMVRGSALRHSLLIIVLGRVDSQMATSRIPGLVNGKLSFRDASIFPVCSEKVDPPTTATPNGSTLTPTKVTSKPSTVVFVKMIKCYANADEWTICAKSPQKCFASWMSSLAVPFLDTWKWARDGSGDRTRYTGVARIPVEKVSSVLAASGSGGWFVDAFRDTEAPSAVIQWQEQANDESDLAYLTRCKRLTPSLGLVAGLKQLGLREPRTEGDAFQKIWMLERVPSEWSHEEAELVLKPFYSDIFFLRRRKSGRNLCDFVFRGTCQKEVDLMPIPVETENGAMTYWTKLAPGRAPNAKRQEVKPITSFAMQKGKPVQTVSKAMPVDADSSSKTGDAAMVESDSKDGAKRARVVVRAIPKGLAKVEAPADGGCLFHCFSVGLSRLAKPIDKHSRELRAIAMSHVAKHRSENEVDWDGKSPDGKPLKSFDEYLQLIVNSKAWGSSLELKALCRKFDIKVTVVSELLNVDPMLFQSTGRRGAFYFWYTGVHFDLLTGTPIDLIDRPYSGVDDIVRGGGSESFQTVWSDSRNSSLDTQWTAVVAQPLASGGAKSVAPGASTAPAPAVVTPLPSSTCSAQSSLARGPVISGRGVLPSEEPVGSGLAKTVWTPLPSNTAVIRRRLIGKRPADFLDASYRGPFPVEAQSAVAEPSEDDFCLDDFQSAEVGLSKRELFHRRGSKFSVGDGLCRWKCDVCPFVVEAKHHDAVCKARYDHNKNAHGGAGQPGRLSRPRDVVAENVAGAIFWRCPLCSFGISAEMRAKISFRVYMEEVRGHRSSHHPKVKLAEWNRLSRQQFMIPELRLKRRVSKLNAFVAMSKKVICPEMASHLVKFSWPEVRVREGRQALVIQNAWQCKKCVRSFRSASVARDHVCKAGLGRRDVDSIVQRLEDDFVKSQKLQHGFELSALRGLFDGAKKFLCGSQSS